MNYLENCEVLSKVLSFDGNYRRDSFSHRICDDLSEVILQFLPIKQKFRFECVSKQFQRTIYKKEYELIIDNLLEFNFQMGSQMRFLFRQPRTPINCSASPRIGKLFGKLPNISALRQNDFKNPLYGNDLILFMENCPKLVSLNCNLNKISGNLINELGERFGHKIISFSPNRNHLKTIEKSFINIKELNCKPNGNSSLTFRHICDLPLKKLKKLSIGLNHGEVYITDELDCMQELLLSHNTLDSLQLYIRTDVPDHSHWDFTFKRITSLNLRELKLKSFYMFSGDSFFKGLKRLSVNCPKLKSLSLKRVYFEEIEEVSSFMNSLNLLNLKRLEIHSNYTDYLKFLNSSTNLKNLTHLKIFGELSMDESLLLNTVNLPKLQILWLDVPISATEMTAHILSGLSRLETLRMKITNKTIARLIETKIKEKCPRIRLIDLKVFKSHGFRHTFVK